ncbi:hypothetical protein BGZ95_003690 [Linnemannia exigua]|uniref:Major facilitator superfamily (MFS) profile domain-containing protein n=1 Tax=Linnemannia exigua TaxID=604196 RepID=A0AAD4D3Y8_9FUNG|nr:hypothetical protein BGZ95_003690 [Linnemannia exigua]
MRHPKPNSINITITPSSRPSTMDEASSPRSGVESGTSNSRRQQRPQHPSKTTASPPPQQYSLESSPTSSSSSSSIGNSNNYENQDASRHVQGLPASALATVDAVLNRTPSRQYHHSAKKTRASQASYYDKAQHEDIDKFDVVDSGDTDDDDNSEIDHYQHQKRKGGGGGVTRDHPLGRGPKVPKAQSQRHIRLADAPIMATSATNTNKGGTPRVPKVTLYEPSNNMSNKVSQQSSVSPLRGERGVQSRPEDSGETEVDRSSSNESRGRNGGHFYNLGNDPLHPQHLQQQQSEKQDQLLEMYRTKSFISELSFERYSAGGGGGGDGCGDAGGVEKRGQYFAAMNFQQDPELERRIVRKLDRHLLPLLGILYLFSYLDRVNIGNARLFGLEEAVHLSNGQYNIALASFFLAYCLFELPSNWVLVRVGPRIWIPILMILWGGVSLALAWVTSFAGLVIARFALGTAEAGFVPGVLFYITLFYKRSEHSFRMAIFLCFNILAGAFGGLLAAAISQLAGVWGLQGWQWIFILEAIPTLLLAVLTWFIMTPSPQAAKFLTEEERIYATNRIIVDSDVLPTAKASWNQTKAALTDVKIYLICLGSVLLHIPSAGVVMFLPTLIADMGFKATTAQLLTVPPYMVAACVSLLIPWWSDRTGIRGYFSIFVPMVSVVGFSLLAFAPWTWQRGHIVMAISICCFILNAFVLRTMLSRENHRRDNNKTKGLRLIQFMSEGHLNDLGDMHPNFRYTL